DAIGSDDETRAQSALNFRFALGTLRTTWLAETTEKFLHGIVRRKTGNTGPLTLGRGGRGAGYADVDHRWTVLFDNPGEVWKVLRRGCAGAGASLRGRVRGVSRRMARQCKRIVNAEHSGNDCGDQPFSCCQSGKHQIGLLKNKAGRWPAMIESCLPDF